MLSYLKNKSLEVLKAMLPLVAVIIIMQFTLLKMPLEQFWSVFSQVSLWQFPA